MKDRLEEIARKLSELINGLENRKVQPSFIQAPHSADKRSIVVLSPPLNSTLARGSG